MKQLLVIDFRCKYTSGFTTSFTKKIELNGKRQNIL